ncbi:hypothetical protein IQ249_11290 [Lusitaniella coriacea LEGE 07157]|uniref:Ubiquinone biosynthesis protein n=1 Tax=Lusitaniella coriacea LEGE 07157 TaxID=945747 RepID=A0A8J7DWI8_9CYAN|nr:Coq4 family protein [Lusitaniella coriacea]MBE9116484.1 hypothetical protein [Lusitaniella coriacea LEGE 07157]
MQDSSLNIILKLAQTINPQVQPKHDFKIDLEYLRNLPEGSLGHAVASFLDEHGFEPLNSGDWIQRTHDVWHVLTGLSPSTNDELVLQAFTRAQLFRPSCAILVLLGLIGNRCSFSDILKAIQYGRLAKRLIDWDIESDWVTPLLEVRQKLGIVPLQEQATMDLIGSSGTAI